MTQQSGGATSDDVSDQDWPIIRAQPRSFFKAPLCTDLDQLEADVAFIGVPFDQGTLGRPGARYGPDARRDAPRAYSYFDPFGQGAEAEGFFDIDAPPVDFAFEVFLRIGQEEWPVGQIDSESEHDWDFSGSFNGRADIRETTLVDLILRPSRVAARQTLRITRIWNGEIILANVPLQWDQQGNR